MEEKREERKKTFVKWYELGLQKCYKHTKNQDRRRLIGNRDLPNLGWL